MTDAAGTLLDRVPVTLRGYEIQESRPETVGGRSERFAVEVELLSGETERVDVQSNLTVWGLKKAICSKLRLPLNTATLSLRDDNGRLRSMYVPTGLLFAAFMGKNPSCIGRYVPTGCRAVSEPRLNHI